MVTQILVYTYFALSVALLFNAIGVVKPRLFPATVMLLGSVSFIVLALFTPQFMLLGLFLTLAVWLHGGLHHGLGQLGLILHLVSWGLLIRQLHLMRTVLPILDGRPISDDEDPFPGQPSKRLDWAHRPLRVAFRPFLLQRTAALREIKVSRGIIYREVNGRRLRVDVYSPRKLLDNGVPLPSVVYLHGGAWLTGTRRQSPFLMYELAAAGYVVFAVDYRLAPRAPMPAGLIDCKAAIAWVRDNAAKYGALPDAVVMGGSAGGHLAAMLAVSDGTALLQPGFEDKDTRVRGAVVLYGVSNLVGMLEGAQHRLSSWLLERIVFKARFADDPELFRRSHPLTYLSNKTPPILLMHGENDSLVPIEETRSFYELLGKAGATRVHLCEIPLAVHAFELTPSPLHQRAVRIIRCFMDTL